MSSLALIRSRFLRLRRWLLTALVLLTLYAVLGFFVLPAVIRAQLPHRLGALLGREVQLQTVRTNPFTLSVTLEGFQVKDRDGGAFLGWERLYVNVQASTLFTRTIDFKAIELVAPYGRVVVENGGRLNFSDILERLAAGSPQGTATKEAPAREIAIGHLRVSGARISLLDRSPSEPFATTLGPLTIELKGFRTAYDRRNPYAFSGRTESGETFAWTGSFSVQPLKSEGTLALENLLLPKYHPYFKDRVAFDLREGLATARASYAFEWAEGRHAVKLLDGSLSLRNLKFSGRDSEKVRVSLPAIDLRGLTADLLDSKVDIAALTLRDGSLEAVRGKNGEIDLVRLFTPKPSPEKEDSKPLRLRLQELALANFQASFADQVPPRPVKAELDQVNLTLRDFSLDPAAAVRLGFDGRLNGRGRIKAEGTAAIFKPTVDLVLKVENLDLPAFDPYLEPALDVRVNRGALNLDGRFIGSFAGTPALAFKGNLRMDAFEAMDGTRQEVFLRYRSFRLNGLDVRTSPEVLKIKSVELLEPENRLVVSADGSTNVARALKLVSASGAAAGAVPPTPQAPTGSPYTVSIAKVAIQRGSLSFIDRSLEPNAALLITELEGSYTGLSTEPETSSAVELKGRAGGLAPILIQGRATPLRHDLDTDLTLKIQGAELSDFSPYAGKHLGYTIRKGKLEVDARLRIQQRRLEIQDKVRMDQFFLGDRVDSPDATKLPVKLALAILRDRKGLIELELPIDGSLDDPDFHYGKIVWKAIVNVLGKIATSPFTLLGKLFGGGDTDLSLVSFEPGSAVPDAAAMKTVDVLRKSLSERPDLSLEVEATADPGSDGAALKKLALVKLLRQAKAKSLRAKQPDLDPATVALVPGERDQWLRAAFESAFPPPPPEKGKEPAPVPPLAEMEQRLLGTLPVAPGDLKALADARTKALVKLLVQDGKVEASRVFEIEGGERAKKEGGSRAFFSLK